MPNKIYSIADARRHAKWRMPKIIFDYVDGAAGSEIANANNCERLDALKLLPRVLRKVEHCSLQTTLFGKQYALPFGIAPMGMCNLIWPGSDRLLATAAAQTNIPLAVSTMASSSLQQVAKWAGGNAWFQLYIGQSIELGFQMVTRAEQAGYETLILTVDVPMLAPRLRDLNNGFKAPLEIGAKQLIDFALHPEWSIRSLLAGVPQLANFGTGDFERDVLRGLVDWDFLDQLRQRWKGNLIVKGVLSTDDAVRIKAAGVDAIYVSNHGGRQLDSAPAAIDQLPLIRAAVGADLPLIFDSGIRNGEGVVKALARGANFVMAGRAVLYGLGGGGEQGLEQVIARLQNEIRLGMAQLGLTAINAIDNAVLAV